MAARETTGGASDGAEAGGAPGQRRGGAAPSEAAGPVVAGGGVLNDGGVIGEAALQRGLRLRRVAHADVLDVAAAEDDVLVDLVSGSHRAVRGAVLRAEGTDFGQSDGGLVGVDRVEDALVSDLGLRDEADLRAEIGDAGGHDDDGVLARSLMREIAGDLCGVVDAFN